MLFSQVLQIAIPVNNKITPPDFVIAGVYFLKLFENAPPDTPVTTQDHGLQFSDPV